MTDKILIERSVMEQVLKVLEYAANDVLTGRNAATALRAALEQPQVEQEPVAWISPNALEWITLESEKVVKLTRKAQPEYDFTEPLYTHPQPPHQPVTNELMDIGWELYGSSDAYQAWCMAVEWTERAHGIKE